MQTQRSTVSSSPSRPNFNIFCRSRTNSRLRGGRRMHQWGIYSSWKMEGSSYVSLGDSFEGCLGKLNKHFLLGLLPNGPSPQGTDCQNYCLTESIFVGNGKLFPSAQANEKNPTLPEPVGKEPHLLGVCQQAAMLWAWDSFHHLYPEKVQFWAHHHCSQQLEGWWGLCFSRVAINLTWVKGDKI